jgi:hypothetical protein
VNRSFGEDFGCIRIGIFGAAAGRTEQQGLGLVGVDLSASGALLRAMMRWHFDEQLCAALHLIVEVQRHFAPSRCQRRRVEAGVLPYLPGPPCAAAVP